jgi:hypothetical protein
MSTDPYDDILKRARNLSPDEMERLINDLTSNRKETNGPNNKKSLFDALHARGLIGSLTNAPADLATNPEYMKDFGRDA